MIFPHWILLQLRERNGEEGLKGLRFIVYSLVGIESLVETINSKPLNP